MRKYFLNLNRFLVITMLMVALTLNCNRVFADASEEFRQKQLEQSPDYYSEENQKEIAELQRKVDDYLSVKEELLQSSGIIHNKIRRELKNFSRRLMNTWKVA